MEVFHASAIKVEHPDTLHSRDFLDFGKGFYITTLRDQAVNYAQRFVRRCHEAWLNVYELDESYCSYEIKVFDSYNEEWLDFVAECRKGNEIGEYDVVRGGIANDKVFRTIDLYFAGDITKDEALRRLLYEKPNDQICIRKQEVIDKCLIYKESIKL